MDATAAIRLKPVAVAVGLLGRNQGRNLRLLAGRAVEDDKPLARSQMLLGPGHQVHIRRAKPLKIGRDKETGMIRHQNEQSSQSQVVRRKPNSVRITGRLSRSMASRKPPSQHVEQDGGYTKQKTFSMGDKWDLRGGPGKGSVV